MTESELVDQSEELSSEDGDSERSTRPARPRQRSWLTRVPLGRPPRGTDSNGGDPPEGPGNPQLAVVRRVGMVLFGVQLCALFAYSIFEFNRWGLSTDYAFYARAFYAMAHLHFPLNFYSNHAELGFTVLAPTYWLWPHGPVLLLEQDLVVVVAEVVAFRWLCDILSARSFPSARLPRLIALAGLATLITDPWIWWALAFDFHFETFGVLFALLTARDLYDGRRRAWLWATLTVLSGDVAITYLVAVVLGALIWAKKWLWAVLAVAGSVGVLFLLHVLGAMRGSENVVPLSAANGQPTTPNVGPSTSALGQLLVTLFAHPGRFFSILWSERLRDWANLAPTGLIGVVVPFILFVPLVVIIETSVYGVSFSQPGLQSIPIYLFLPIGTTVALAWLARRSGRIAAVAALLVIADAVAWGAIWLPQTGTHWIRVPEASAAQIAKFAARIPEADTVAASPGIEGRFATRLNSEAVSDKERFIPLVTRHLWVIVTPNLATEAVPAAFQNGVIAELAASPQAKPIVASHGVFGFEYTRAAGEEFLRLPKVVPASLPAWLFRSTTGKVTTTGPTSRWRIVGAGRKGYLVWGDYWNEATGPAVATATLTGSGPVTVEVWDDTTNTLLARRQPHLSGSRVLVRIPFAVPSASKKTRQFEGWGPFRSPIIAPSADQLEVRVFTPGPAARIDAYSVGVYSQPA